MKHNYFYFNKEELLRDPKIPIYVMKDEQAVFKEMAMEMVEEIERKNQLGERTVFICPVGPTGQYPYFVELINEKNIMLKNVWIINMDEYLTEDKKWIPENDSLSFRGFMNREVYGRIKPQLLMPEKQWVFPDP